MLGLWLWLVVGCSGTSDRTDSEDAAVADVAIDRELDDAAIDAPGATLTAIALPQAIGGAFLANPSVYTSVPVHVRVDGAASEVRVRVGTDEIVARSSGEDWIADVTLPAAGTYDVEAIATGQNELRAEAELVVAEGAEIATFGADGLMTTPALHHVGEKLYLSFVAREGDRGVVIRPIDGAGRPAGDDLELDLGDPPVIYGEVAMSSDRIAVLFQRSGAPFASFFRMFDRGGTPITDVVALDPEGYGGMSGGAIALDGTGFSVVYRSGGGPGPSRLMFARFDAQSGDVVGPLVLAEERDREDGRFDPSSPVGVAPGDGKTFVAFTRKAFDSVLELWVPKSELAIVAHDGTIESVETTARESGWGLFHWESYVFGLGDRALAVSVANALNEDTDVPLQLLASERGLDGTPVIDTWTSLVDAPDNRYEPFVAAVPGHSWGVIVWGDGRSYATDLVHGRIQLYAGDLTEHGVMSPVVYEHARLFAGMAHARAVAAGTNAVITWLDDRHSPSVFDRQPDLYVETVWF